MPTTRGTLALVLILVVLDEQASAQQWQSPGCEESGPSYYRSYGYGHGSRQAAWPQVAPWGSATYAHAGGYGTDWNQFQHLQPGYNPGYGYGWDGGYQQPVQPPLAQGWGETQVQDGDGDNGHGWEEGWKSGAHSQQQYGWSGGHPAYGYAWNNYDQHGGWGHQGHHGHHGQHQEHDGHHGQHHQHHEEQQQGHFGHLASGQDPTWENSPAPIGRGPRWARHSLPVPLPLPQAKPQTKPQVKPQVKPQTVAAAAVAAPPPRWVQDPSLARPLGDVVLVDGTRVAVRDFRLVLEHYLRGGWHDVVADSGARIASHTFDEFERSVRKYPCHVPVSSHSAVLGATYCRVVRTALKQDANAVLRAADGSACSLRQLPGRPKFAAWLHAMYPDAMRPVARGRGDAVPHVWLGPAAATPAPAVTSSTPSPWTEPEDDDDEEDEEGDDDEAQPAQQDGLDSDAVPASEASPQHP